MSEIKRKKVVFVTDSTIAFTGFGKAAKNYIEYLYKLNKYDIVHIAMGMTNVNETELQRFPWSTKAAVNIQQLENIKRSNDPRNHEGIDRMAGYGAFSTDEIVRNEKPDIVIATQDIWGIDHILDKSWSNKITTALWTTLDSLPIIPKAVEVAPKVKNYWSWADFATKALHKLGHTHVKTVRGPLNIDNFFRLTDENKKQLRFKNSIGEKDFIIGFVFRNQLRKSVPNLLEGFCLFKKDNPSIKTKLLLHTSWTEGWDIPKLMSEHSINKEDILTTYVCKNCKNYEIKPFNGHDLNCPHCKAQKTQCTPNPTLGVDEKQLNEIYNLMSVYVHCMTSGGQEIPIQEAKLTETITLVTNYSCGEDSCQPEAASLPLDWAEYREPGTQFIKASTYPSSIAKQLKRVLLMSEQQRREMGKTGRQWVIDNFSTETIGNFLQEFIDNSPFASEEAFNQKEEPKDPTHVVPEIQNNSEWVLYLYRNILKSENINVNDDGYKHWMQKLSEGMSRQEIENYFRKVAWEDNQKINSKPTSFEDLLDSNDKRRVLFVCKESAGDILRLYKIRI